MNTDSHIQQQEVSAIVITQNEERNIKECLDSLKWVNEIVVVDGGSTDRTLEIARKFTDKVYHNSWPGFAPQKRYSLAKASKPWVISIDSDERVTPELRDEIIALLKSESIFHQGYYIPRLSTFLEKFI